MSNKVKLVSVIAAFVLILTLAIAGVAAAQSVTVNLGGTITFNATDVQATISAGVITNGSVTDAENKLQHVVLDADNDGATSIATWSGLNLTFDEGRDDLTITFTITNDHEEKGLNVATVQTDGTVDNMTMTTTVEGGTGTVQNNVIPVGGSADYTVTFHITDQNSSASIAGFNLAITLTTAD